MSVKASVSMSENQDAFVKSLVAQGRYASASAVVQQPETDRIEDVPQHPRLRQQVDRTISKIAQPLTRDHVPYPSRAATGTADAPVVHVMQRCQVAAVAREQRGAALPRLCINTLGVDQDVIHAIGKAVAYGPAPSVPCAARDMLGPQAHCGDCFIAEATSSALASPSS